jgi:simple sugar transport system substrate-binding protein
VDVKAQAEMVRKAVADGYDGIALNVIHPTAFQQVIAEAHAKNVPVVAFNTAARPAGEKDAPGPLAAVCQDYAKAGRMLATKALDFLPAGSKVLLTQHDVGVASLDARLAGVQEVLKARGIAWKVICSSNDPQKARDTIAAELKANPRIKVVLATGLTDTEAAGRAIERDFAGKGYAAAGFDLSPDILRLVKAGTIRFTIDQQPYIQGYYPVVQLALFRRFGIRPADLDAGAGIVGQDDVDRVMELSKRGYR